MEPLRCTSEVCLMLYVNYISIKKDSIRNLCDPDSPRTGDWTGEAFQILHPSSYEAEALFQVQCEIVELRRPSS